MTDGREYDLEECRRVSNSPDPLVRKMAHETAMKIGKESGRIKSMREALVKEHRAGNIENIKDIHDYIQKHRGSYE